MVIAGKMRNTKMKNWMLAVFCVVASSNQLMAQEDSLMMSLLDGPAEAPVEKVHSAFKTTKVINLQSTELTDAGVFDFKMSHRFGPVNSGRDNAYGLDFATIRFGGELGVLPNLMIGVGRSNIKSEKLVDGYVKWRVMHQTSDNKKPVSILLLGGVDFRNTRYSVNFKNQKGIDSLGFLFVPKSVRTAYVAQCIIGKKVNSNFSYEIVPGWVKQSTITASKATGFGDYQNAVKSTSQVYLGMGFRQKLSSRTSLNVEYIPILMNKGNSVNSFSLGLDLETGGHVFQFQFTNSLGLNESMFIARTTDKWNQAGVRFGFNLHRVFTVIDPEFYRKPTMN